MCIFGPYKRDDAKLGPWVNHWQVGHFAPYTGEIYNPHWAWEVRRKALASMEKQRAGSAILGHNLRRHINSTHQLSSLLVFGQFCGFQLQVPILRDRGGPNAAVKIQVRLCVRYAPRWRLARSLARAHISFSSRIGVFAETDFQHSLWTNRLQHLTEVYPWNVKCVHFWHQILKCDWRQVSLIVGQRHQQILICLRGFIQQIICGHNTSRFNKYKNYK